MKDKGCYSERSKVRMILIMSDKNYMYLYGYLVSRNIKPKTVMSENSTKGPTLPKRATQASHLRFSGMNGHAQGSGTNYVAFV